MVYSLENVRKLKEVTGIGIKKCMEALNSNENDFDKSLEWLKKYSISVRNVSFLGGESVSCGVTFLRGDSEKAVSFILSCESDFAEKSDSFRDLSEEIGDIIFNKFEEVAKFSQIENDIEKLVEEKISRVSLSIKEKISVKNVKLFTKEKKEQFGFYLHHNKKLCSLVVIKNGTKEIAHEIALQVAVSKPSFISRKFVPNEVIQSKVNEIKENLPGEMREKSALILRNVIEGKLNKWYSEICFLEKVDFRNHERLVGEIVSSFGITVERIFYEKI